MAGKDRESNDFILVKSFVLGPDGRIQIGVAPKVVLSITTIQVEPIAQRKYVELKFTSDAFIDIKEIPSDEPGVDEGKT